MDTDAPAAEKTKTTSEQDGLFVQEKKEESVSLFLFELDKELYAVSATEVDQVMKIPPVTSVPNSPDSILGIFHLRGKVIVAIDILKRMRIVRQTLFVPLYLFISHKQNNYFAVVLDHVYSVIEVPKKDIAPLASAISLKIDAQYVEGMFMYREPVKKHKRVDNFLIEPKHETEAVPEVPMRPVLWLNTTLLLDQQDILAVAAQPPHA